MTPLTEALTALLSEAPGGSLTARKAATMISLSGLHVSGLVLCHPDGRRAVLEAGAVRWLSNEQMRTLLNAEGGI